jgi:hypothetical protein
MREKISTAVEVVGALSIAIGVGTILGLGAALIAGGILAIVGSVLADFAGFGGNE